MKYTLAKLFFITLFLFAFLALDIVNIKTTYASHAPQCTAGLGPFNVKFEADRSLIAGETVTCQSEQGNPNCKNCCTHGGICTKQKTACTFTAGKSCEFAENDCACNPFKLTCTYTYKNPTTNEIIVPTTEFYKDDNYSGGKNGASSTIPLKLPAKPPPPPPPSEPLPSKSPVPLPSTSPVPGYVCPVVPPNPNNPCQACRPGTNDCVTDNSCCHMEYSACIEGFKRCIAVPGQGTPACNVGENVSCGPSDTPEEPTTKPGEPTKKPSEPTTKPSASPTPKPDYSDAMCECDNITAQGSILPGREFTVVAGAKVIGTNTSKAEVRSITFHLEKEINVNQTIREFSSSPITPSILSSSPTLTKYAATWKHKIETVKSGDTYRVVAKINCGQKRPSSQQPVLGAQSSVRKEVLQATGSLQIDTFYPGEIINDQARKCTMLRVKFNAK